MASEYTSSAAFSFINFTIYLSTAYYFLGLRNTKNGIRCMIFCFHSMHSIAAGVGLELELKLELELELGSSSTIGVGVGVYCTHRKVPYFYDTIRYDIYRDFIINYLGNHL